MLVSVEGQTEEVMVIRVLQEYLSRWGLFILPVIVATKRVAGMPTHKGGLSTWAKTEREIRQLLGDTSAVAVTTMYDLYAFPDDAPGMATRMTVAPGIARAQHVEEAMMQAIASTRFIPYLSLHEIEALVLAAPFAILEEAAESSQRADVSPLQQIGDPELVNEADPPSKRLLRCWPEYTKPIDGPWIVGSSGIDHVRSKCPHFDAWLRRLETL